MLSPFDDPNAPAERPATDPAEPFTQMAKQISHNKGSHFGGAFVIVPPGEEAPLSTLVLTTDPAEFWMIVHAKIQVRLREIERKETQAGAFGMRR